MPFTSGLFRFPRLAPLQEAICNDLLEPVIAFKQHVVETVAAFVQALFNDAPAAAGDAYSTDEYTALIVPAAGVLANDSDGEGDPLTAALVSGPDNGLLAFNSDGSFTYTPDPDFTGTDSFT